MTDLIKKDKSILTFDATGVAIPVAITISSSENNGIVKYIVELCPEHLEYLERIENKLDRILKIFIFDDPLNKNKK